MLALLGHQKQQSRSHPIGGAKYQHYGDSMTIILDLRSRRYCSPDQAFSSPLISPRTISSARTLSRADVTYMTPDIEIFTHAGDRAVCILFGASSSNSNVPIVI